MLGTGDTFGHAAMLSGLPPGFEARAAEDTLCYRIPVSVARPLLDRVKRRELELASGPPNHRPVTRLLRSPTVRCEPMESIREVARRMTAAGASSAIVDLRGGGLRDRHRPRHPDQDRRRGPAVERAGVDRDDHAGVHGHPGPARRRRAVRAARARDPARAGRDRERPADRRDRGRGPVRGTVAVVVRGAALDLARFVRRGPGRGRAAAARGGGGPARGASARARGRPGALGARRRADRPRARAGRAGAGRVRGRGVGGARQPGAARADAGLDRARGGGVPRAPAGGVGRGGRPGSARVRLPGRGGRAEHGAIGATPTARTRWSCRC